MYERQTEWERDDYVCVRDVYACVTFSHLTEEGLWRSNRAWYEEQRGRQTEMETDRWRERGREGERDAKREGGYK